MAAAAATTTVVQEVEVGLALRQDPDPVLYTRRGEGPPGQEGSADCGASTGEWGWAGCPGDGGGPALRLIKQVLLQPAAR